MYAQPQSGGAAVPAAAPTLHLGTYRRALLAVIIGNPLFTDAEQVLANHNAHECRDAQRLALWTRNSLRVAKEREAAAAPTGNLLADLQNPAFVAQHGSKQAAAGFPTLTVADAYKAAESLRQAFAASAAQQPAAEPTAAPQPTAPAPPAWVTTRGRITRAQRQELERRLRPQVGKSIWAAHLLDTMSQWSAARATAELVKLGVCNVSNEVARDLRFSVSAVMAPGLLPRRAYAAFKCLRRVVLPTHRDMQFAQPGERFDYFLGQN